MNEKQIVHVLFEGNVIEFLIEPSGKTTLDVLQQASTSRLSIPATPFGTTQDSITYLGKANGKGQTNQQVLDSMTDAPQYPGEANKLRQLIQPVASTASG